MNFIRVIAKYQRSWRKCVDGMKAGDSKQVTIKPGDAYGPLNKDAISKIKKGQLTQEVLTVCVKLQGQGNE